MDGQTYIMDGQTYILIYVCEKFWSEQGCQIFRFQSNFINSLCELIKSRTIRQHRTPRCKQQRVASERHITTDLLWCHDRFMMSWSLLVTINDWTKIKKRDSKRSRKSPFRVATQTPAAPWPPWLEGLVQYVVQGGSQPPPSVCKCSRIGLND